MNDVTEQPVAAVTWTLRQIDQVSGLRCRVFVDEGVIAQSEVADVLAVTREKLARTMQAMAHPFAVEIDAGDLEFREWPAEDVPFAMRVECRWNPTTKVCEMRGGPRDGEVLAFRNPGQPIAFPVFAQPVWTTTETFPAEPVSTHIVYVLAGWSETQRRWVYEPA